MEQQLGAFFDAWALSDGPAREAALEPALAPCFDYCDPNSPGVISDLGMLCDYIDAFTARMPGAHAQVITCDIHNQHARIGVEFTAHGRALMRGQYFAVLDELGRIERIAGFHGMGDPT